MSAQTENIVIRSSTYWNFTASYYCMFLPARRYASAGNRHSNVSVCLSVTHRYCVKTKKASGMISSQSGSPKTLVFSSFKRQYLENGSRYSQSYY